MLLVVLVAGLVIAATAFLSLIEAAMVAVDELRLVTLLYNRPENKQAINKIFEKKKGAPFCHCAAEHLDQHLRQHLSRCHGGEKT